MDEFELYMIDTMKQYADRLRNEKNEDISWMEKNVLTEMIEVLVRYEAHNKGIIVETFSCEREFTTNDEVQLKPIDGLTA